MNTVDESGKGIFFLNACLRSQCVLANLMKDIHIFRTSEMVNKDMLSHFFTQQVFFSEKEILFLIALQLEVYLVQMQQGESNIFICQMI